MSENRIEISPFEYSEYFFKTTGLLVSADKNGKFNMMALDWKTIGDLWYHPIITIAVAYNRYTYELLTENLDEFTINIPSNKTSHAIDIGGSYSGKTTDKIKQAGLIMIPGKMVKVPTIADCLLSYECKIIGSSKTEFKASHHLFFGEILAAYAFKDIIS
ncbi:MAG: flavin reductase family protein [Promethearchaeota archaeon]